MHMTAKATTSATFEQDVLQAEGPVLVVLQDQHDRPVEVGVQQLRSGNQQSGLCGRQRGSHRSFPVAEPTSASPSNVFASVLSRKPTNWPPANSV